jgi:hypothetical protein
VAPDSDTADHAEAPTDCRRRVSAPRSTGSVSVTARTS